MVVSTRHPDVRESFLEGVKAAFIVSQLNRLGQVLCAKCGMGFSSVEIAWGNLGLHRVIDTGRGGYDGELDWGEDHPNYLLLVCNRCKRP